MRLAINVTRDGDPRLVEEDIEIALGKLPWIQRHELTSEDWEISEWGDDGCFTVDTQYSGFGDLTGIENALARRIEEDTGAIVTVERFDGFPPAGWQGGL